MLAQKTTISPLLQNASNSTFRNKDQYASNQRMYTKQKNSTKELRKQLNGKTCEDKFLGNPKQIFDRGVRQQTICLDILKMQ